MVYRKKKKKRATTQSTFKTRRVFRQHCCASKQDLYHDYKQLFLNIDVLQAWPFQGSLFK